MENNNKILSQVDLLTVIERYESRIQKYGVSLESLNSGDDKKQKERCFAHLGCINSDSSILDIGSGLGYFYLFLKEQKINFTYTGYDIVGEYVDFCQKNYKDASFEQRNIFENGISQKYDSIIMSQVLNNRYSSSDNFQVMCQAIQLAYNHSNHSVSIDMMSSYVDFENPELYYYQPEEIFKFAKSLTKKVKLLHDYRPFEFCIQLFH